MADGLIFESVRRLDGDAEFVAAVDAVDGVDRSTSTPCSLRPAEVVAGGAGDPIVYVHTLTPTAAIRQVATSSIAAVVDLVLGCAWRAVAALVSTYRLPACRRVADAAATSTPTRSSTGRCASGDEHAIKVAEAAFGPDAVRRSDGARRRRRAGRSTQWLTARRRGPDVRLAVDVATASLTLGAAVGVFGLVFGVGAVAAGGSVVQACVMSLLVFTGASQFSAVSVVAAGGGDVGGPRRGDGAGGPQRGLRAGDVAGDHRIVRPPGASPPS